MISISYHEELFLQTILFTTNKTFQSYLTYNRDTVCCLRVNDDTQRTHQLCIIVTQYIQGLAHDYSNSGALAMELQHLYILPNPSNHENVNDLHNLFSYEVEVTMNVYV